jgi:hypothetical protein
MATGKQMTPLRTRRPGGRRSAPDEVWARVRAEYLAGSSAAEACRRHGVGLTACRDRAAREGWRRMDQIWAPPPNRLEAWDEGVLLDDQVRGDLDKIHLRQLSFVAHRRMMRAVLRGDAAEALRWRRVRLAIDAEDAEIDRQTGQHESIRNDRAGWAELAALEAAGRKAGETDSADASDGVFGDRT